MNECFAPNLVQITLSQIHNTQGADLGVVLGSLEIAQAIVEGRSIIAREQAYALGQFLHVDPELFNAG